MVGPIHARKYFIAKVEDFVHNSFDFAPIVGYLARREDYNLERLETVQPQVVDKQHMD